MVAGKGLNIDTVVILTSEDANVILTVLLMRQASRVDDSQSSSFFLRFTFHFVIFLAAFLLPLKWATSLEALNANEIGIC